MPPFKKKYSKGFVRLPHNLIESDAYKQLSAIATRAFTYFRRDLKNNHQKEVALTFGQAKNYGVCDSSTTFSKVKKELVNMGCLIL